MLHLAFALFPYTTLFRSLGFVVVRSRAVAWRSRGKDEVFSADGGRVAFLERVHGHAQETRPVRRRQRTPRSEEHTSELQSRRDLVCRLLLEKKKKKKTRT